MKSFSRYRRRIGFALIGLALSSSGSLQAQNKNNHATRPQRILIVGDSLSAEYGLTRGAGWVELLKQSLNGMHPSVEITNASISGDTTSGGLSRFPALLARLEPDIVVIELGANDALRGLPLAMTKNNLLAMIRQAKNRNIKVLLAGMQIPPNYGREYSTAFRKIFDDLSEEEQTGLIPFFLEGIADQPEMFQADTIHPNEQAQPILMENVRRALLPLLEQKSTSAVSRP
jgi:acyl-CoA thioesterase I